MLNTKIILFDKIFTYLLDPNTSFRKYFTQYIISLTKSAFQTSSSEKFNVARINKKNNVDAKLNVGTNINPK